MGFRRWANEIDKYSSGAGRLPGQPLLQRWRVRGDLKSVLLPGSSRHSPCPFCSTLSRFFPKLTHKAFPAVPGPSVQSSFESWVRRSAGTDPSLRPCQSAVSTRRRFPGRAALRSAWASLPTTGQSTGDGRSGRPFQASFTRLAPVVSSPAGALHIHPRSFPHPSVPMGNRTASDRDLRGPEHCT